MALPRHSCPPLSGGLFPHNLPPYLLLCITPIVTCSTPFWMWCAQWGFFGLRVGIYYEWLWLPQESGSDFVFCFYYFRWVIDKRTGVVENQKSCGKHNQPRGDCRALFRRTFEGPTYKKKKNKKIKLFRGLCARFCPMRRRAIVWGKCNHNTYGIIPWDSVTATGQKQIIHSWIMENSDQYCRCF